MTRIALILLFCLGAGTVYAAPIAVRGETHAGGMRLVFERSNHQSWSVARSNGAYEIRFADGDELVGLEPLTASAPEDLQFDITWHSTSDGLVVSLDCDCDPRASAPDPSSLFVDLERRRATPDARRHSTVNSSPQWVEDMFRSTGEKVDETAHKADTGVASVADADPADHIADELLRQISRAAGQGLVQLELPEAFPVETENSDLMPEKQRSSGSGMDKNPNIEIETAVDKNNLDTRARPKNAAGIRCFADSHFDIETWGTPGGFPQRVGLMRQNLFDAKDKPRADDAIALAKAYIYYGFGAEAKQVLNTLVPPSDVSGWLRDLAHIVEQEAVPDPAHWMNFLSCDTRAALWAALAVPDLSGIFGLDTKAIVRGFSGLPAHLRRHLGPGLIDKFIDAGAVDMAELIRNAVKRVPGQSEAVLGLSGARLQHARDDAQASEAPLRDVAGGNNAQAPEALALIVDAQLQEEKHVPWELGQTLAAFAFEHRDTPLGQRLSELAIAVAAQNSRLSEVEQLVKDLPMAARQNALSNAFVHFASKASDQSFLHYVFWVERLDQTLRLKPKHKEYGANRLIALGFAAQATRVIQGQDNSTHLSLLRAKIAFAEGKSDVAQKILSGSTKPDAAAIEAQIARKRHDWNIAAQKYQDADMPEHSLAMAWLGGLWDRFETEPETRQGRFAAFLKTPAPDVAAPGSEIPRLSTARDLVSRSGELRDLVRDLLQ